MSRLREKGGVRSRLRGKVRETAGRWESAFYACLSPPDAAVACSSLGDKPAGAFPLPMPPSPAAV